jgi:acetyltransferase-like isoleucine patch superfamily enzyme
VFEGVYLRHTERLRLGDHVSIHPMSYLDADGGLEIGSDVSIAHGTTIMTTEHDYAFSGGTMRDAPVKPSAVKIGSDVWLGAGVKILAGVNIGDHVVVGAGAVVTKDIPSNSIAVGVPARVVKSLDKGL